MGYLIRLVSILLLNIVPAFSEVWSHAGTFNSTTSVATTTVAVTGMPGQPKAMVLWWNGRTETADAGGGFSYKRGIGFVTSTSARNCVTTQSEDALATMQATNGYREDAAVCITDTTGPFVGMLDLQSFDANGATFIVDDQFPNSITIGYMAWGGSTITGAATGRFQMDTVTGSHIINTTGIDPNFVMFAGRTGATADPPATADDSSMMIGAATGPSNEWVWWGMSDDAETTSVANGYFFNGNCIVFPDSTGSALSTRAEFTQFVTGGFEINILETPGTATDLFYLVIEGGDFRVGTLTTLTDTTTDIVVSGLASRPSGALLVSAGRALSTSDTVSNDDRLSIGAWSSLANQFSQATWEDDGNVTSTVAAALEFNQCYLNLDGDVNVGEMRILSIEPTGFTMRMSDADPVGAAVGYISTGPAATTSAVPVFLTEYRRRRN